jgi:glycosyltransferase involved in cell wall biosynthesis
MEYGAAGVPTIASPVAPYLRYIEHGKDGFLAKKHSDWVKYLRLLIENDDLRAEMAENAVSKAEKMDIRANLEPRIALYERLFAEIGAERVARAAELVEAVQDKQEINPGGIFGGLNV